MTDFYLVQRLNKRTYKRPDDKGLDVNFQLDYMGSSEFEWGAIPKALKSLRENAHEFRMHETTLTIGSTTRTVYFICDQRKYRELRDSFDAWIEAGMFGKEHSAFEEAFTGRDQWRDVIAWWAIDTDVAWALDREVGEQLLEGLTGANVGAGE